MMCRMAIFIAINRHVNTLIALLPLSLCAHSYIYGCCVLFSFMIELCDVILNISNKIMTLNCQLKSLHSLCSVSSYRDGKKTSVQRIYRQSQLQRHHAAEQPFSTSIEVWFTLDASRFKLWPGTDLLYCMRVQHFCCGVCEKMVIQITTLHIK